MTRCSQLLVGALSFVVLSWGTKVVAGSPDQAAVERARQPALRRPLSLVWNDQEARLYVANRCGTVSVVDSTTWKVVSETAVAEELAALCRMEPNRLLAVDPARHLVLQLSVEGDRVSVTQQLDVSPYPVNVIFHQDRREAYVASLWSRRLTRVVWREGSLRSAGCLDLPFAPRCLVLSPNGQYLVVADSFAGQLGLVDLDQFAYRATRAFPAHNIRGLVSSIDGSMLIVAHQMLNDLAHTTRNDVHWGLLMSNDLRWLRWESVLTADKDIYAGAHMHPLGEAGSATADPAGLAVAATGQVVVTLGGVGEVALGRESDFSLYRLRVGRRPTAVVVNASGTRAVVANTFDDTLSVIDLEARRVVHQVELGPLAVPSPIDEGELLFYDGRLSHDGWMSCHSCHTDGHTNGGLNDNFSDQSFGAPKRVLSLLGVADTAPYAWLGHADSLEKQIDNSISNTMQGEVQLSQQQKQALIAYLRSLKVPPSVDRLRGVVDEAAIARGAQVFARRQCDQCHVPPSYTSADSYEVGLVDQRGNRKFNPPSLRGLSHRGPYFHDNAASTLDEVFRTYGHPHNSVYTEEEVRDLVAFLRSL